MDSAYQTRIAMAGWMFVAVIVSSLWQTDSDYWKALMAALRDIGSSGNAAIAVAALGAIIGIGAPPAIGFLLERAVSVLYGAAKMIWWRLGGRRTELRSYLASLTSEDRRRQIEALDGAAVSRVFFHSKDNEALVKYREWRKTQFYASLTSALALLFGWLTAVLVFGAFSYPVTAVAGIYVVILVGHGLSAARSERQLMRAWTRTRGLQAVTDFAKAQDPPRPARTSSRSGCNLLLVWIWRGVRGLFSVLARFLRRTR